VTDETLVADNPRLASLLTRLDQKQLPSMPAVAARLNQLLCQDQFEIADVVGIVESDASLAARLLKVTNSAAMGLRHPATSVERAVLMLGLKGVRNVAMGVALIHGIARPRSKFFDHQLFWRDSIRRSVASRVFAAHWPGCDKEEAYLGALLQDMAVPILVLSLGPDYGSVLREWTHTRRPLRDIETEQMGGNHADVGAWLANKWQFDPSIVSMIGCHHEPMTPSSPEQGADTCVKLSAIVPSTKAKDTRPLQRLAEVWDEHCPVSLDALVQDLSKIDEQFEEVSEAFQVRRGWTLPLSTLYERTAAEV